MVIWIEVIATSGGLKFLQNNGNRTFTDITEFTSLPPAGWIPSGMVACDFDRDSGFGCA